MKRAIFLCGVLALLGPGCKKEKKSAVDQLPVANIQGGQGAGRPMQSPHGAMADAGPGMASAGGMGTATGTVLETMDSGGYTYVKIQSAQGTAWAAGPVTSLKVGDTVSYSQGMPMQDFHSNTLNRTFDVVYFVQGYKVGASGAAPANPHGAMADAGPGVAAPVVANVKVDMAKGGKTIEQVFAGKAQLVGKDVTVRGKVVKYNGGIMGKNWLHIQDGSGAAGTNDLTITTQATTKVGDTVVVQGKVGLDKDFGAGYKYDVILEDAALTVE